MPKINWSKSNSRYGTTTQEELDQIHGNENVLGSRYGYTRPIVTKRKTQPLYDQYGREVDQEAIGEVPVFSTATAMDPDVFADLQGIRSGGFRTSIEGYITEDENGNRIYHSNRGGGYLKNSGIRGAKQSLRSR